MSKKEKGLRSLEQLLAAAIADHEKIKKDRSNDYEIIQVPGPRFNNPDPMPQFNPCAMHSGSPTIQFEQDLMSFCTVLRCMDLLKGTLGISSYKDLASTPLNIHRVALALLHFQSVQESFDSFSFLIAVVEKAWEFV